MVMFDSGEKETTEKICNRTNHFDPVWMETVATQSDLKC